MSTSPHLQPPRSAGSGTSPDGTGDVRRQTQLRADSEVLGVDWRLVGRERGRQRRACQSHGAAAGSSRRRTDRAVRIHPRPHPQHQRDGASTAAACGRSPRRPGRATHGGSRQTAAVLRRTSMVLGILGATPARGVLPPDFGMDVRHPRLCRAGRPAVARAIVQVNQRWSGRLDPGNAAHRRSGHGSGCWAALLGTAISLGLIYFFREQAVVPSLVAVAADHAGHLLVVPTENAHPGGSH